MSGHLVLLCLLGQGQSISNSLHVRGLRRVGLEVVVVGLDSVVVVLDSVVVVLDSVVVVLVVVHPRNFDSIEVGRFSWVVVFNSRCNLTP